MSFFMRSPLSVVALGVFVAKYASISNRLLICFRKPSGDVITLQRLRAVLIVAAAYEANQHGDTG